jgi:hypothetical protein
VIRYGQYGRKLSWNVKWYGKYGRKASRIVIRFGQYRRKASWIVKRYIKKMEEIQVQLWKNMENTEERQVE